jgi:hypothetical protein
MATRWVTINYIDEAALFTNLEDRVDDNTYPQLSVNNLKRLSKSLVTRSLSSSSFNIYGVLTQPETVNCFIICGHNFTEGTDISLQFYYDNSLDIDSRIYNYSTQITSANAEQSGIMTNLAIWLDTPISIASFNLSMSVSITNPTNYFQIYKLFCGNYFQSRVSASLGNIWYYKDGSNQYRTDAGSLRTDIVASPKSFEFSLNTITEIERSQLQRELAKVGMRKEFYISAFKNSCESDKEVDYSGVVKLTRIPSYSEIIDNIYSGSLAVEEV